MQALNPTSSVAAHDVLKSLAIASRRMPLSARALWETRIEHIYGDLSGQRALNVNELITQNESAKSEITLTDTVIALETYFTIVCDLIAISSLQDNPHSYLLTLSRRRPDSLSTYFSELSSGKLHTSHGVTGAEHAFHFDWYAECLDRHGWSGLAEIASAIAELWDGHRMLISGLDPMQQIHDIILPKNLRHATGQFYTPEWLAAQLLQDTSWTPEQTLIDPFAGSGVFILSALRRASELGFDPSEALKMVSAIELNPSACVAIRTNLALFFRNKIRKEGWTLTPAIFCADSLAPAIVAGAKVQSNLFTTSEEEILVDGERVTLPLYKDPKTQDVLASALNYYGLPTYPLDIALSEPASDLDKAPYKNGVRARRIVEQLSTFLMRPADVLVTNPPWIGWEYMSRQYRTYVQPAWDAYDLFNAKGREMAFLKEDISNMAMVAAWDLFLREGGASAAVLRPATMRSDLTAKGMRRMTLRANTHPIKLVRVREFSGFRVFPGAAVEASTWQIIKGQPTEFPVNVSEWKRATARWHPNSSDPLPRLLENITTTEKVVTRVNPNDVHSRWAVDDESSTTYSDNIAGKNNYQPRIGVFTGGANAVFYLEMIEAKHNGTSRYRNIVERAKRQVEQCEADLENPLVYPILRGRDIERWHAKPEVHILCPHTADTKMKPIDVSTLKSRYPLAFRYLSSKEPFLRERGGFSGWEKHILEESYYAIQRVGDYTFARHKVCWRYIASDFVVAVCDEHEGRTILPNDKVIFLSFDDRDEAYFVCGLLSASVIRARVVASMSGRQISANIIKNFSLPTYDPNDSIHRSISIACADGHAAIRAGNLKVANDKQSELDMQVATLYKMPNTAVESSLASLRRASIKPYFESHR